MESVLKFTVNKVRANDAITGIIVVYLQGIKRFALSRSIW